MKFGTVAIVGRPNVGKSTFLNAVLEQKLAIVSPTPQTSRDTLLGVVNRPDAQIAFLDTPGVHRPRTELGRRMNTSAFEACRAADVIVYVTDVVALGKHTTGRPTTRSNGTTNLLPKEDRRLLEQVREYAATPCILLLNKVDTLKDKRSLLPLMAALEHLGMFRTLLPTSVLDPEGVIAVLDEIEAHLPDGSAAYDSDALTNRSEAFFVKEYIREQVLLNARQEVPHAVAITLERFDACTELTEISATIHVEKVGQRRILIGRGGEKIRDIRLRARRRIKTLLGRPTKLELFVRVTSQWRNLPRQLAELGYDEAIDDPATLPQCFDESSDTFVATSTEPSTP